DRSTRGCALGEARSRRRRRSDARRRAGRLRHAERLAGRPAVGGARTRGTAGGPALRIGHPPSPYHPEQGQPAPRGWAGGGIFRLSAVELARPATDADRASCMQLLGAALTRATSMRGGPALVRRATA